MFEISSVVFLIVAFLLISVVLLIGTGLYAFTSPRKFADGLTPYRWFRDRYFKKSASKYDVWISFTVGTTALCVMAFLEFILGGFVSTMVFELWQSPFAFLLL